MQTQPPHTESISEELIDEKILTYNSSTLHTMFKRMSREKAEKTARQLQDMFFKKEESENDVIRVLFVLVEECPFITFSDKFKAALEREASKREVLERLCGELEALQES